MNYQPTPEGKDPLLWQTAHRRVSFKKHLVSYVIVNLFLWLVWFFTGPQIEEPGLPWPIWSGIGWGIGLAFHYFNAYVANPYNSVEREYDKLTGNQHKS